MFLGNLFGNVPRSRDSGGSVSDLAYRSADVAFRHHNGVSCPSPMAWSFHDVVRFRSSILAARFLTVYASTPVGHPTNGKTRYRLARFMARAE